MYPEYYTEKEGGKILPFPTHIKWEFGDILLLNERNAHKIIIHGLPVHSLIFNEPINTPITEKLRWDCINGFMLGKSTGKLTCSVVNGINSVAVLLEKH